MRTAGALSYLLTDHLGSTAVTTDAGGAQAAEMKYYPFGATRYNSGGQKTTYRFTGQRFGPGGGGLYDYGARWYDSTIGRFIQADSIVPNLANPQSLNRYSYVRNNPLRLVDPSGMAECAAGDTACWQSEWEWKNRWYEAHGWFADNGGWTRQGDAQFKDDAIFNDTMAEAGIKIVGQWQSKDQRIYLAQGIVRFGQALLGGLARLKELLGGGATIKNGSLNGSPYAPFWFNNTVYIPESTDAQWLRQSVVHELAHVIDWHNNFSIAWAKQNGALTGYAASFHPYPAVWEVWAEAVTVWVFGNKDPNLGVWTSSISLLPGMQNALTTQMDRLTVLLGGSR